MDGGVTVLGWCLRAAALPLSVSASAAFGSTWPSHQPADVDSVGSETTCGSRGHLPRNEGLGIKAIFACYNYH